MMKGKTMNFHAMPVIQERLVQNPLRTDAQLDHERSSAEDVTVVGMIRANVNMTTLIGGLARVRSRSEAQTLAAARYRGLFERSLVGGARATDYSAVRVDVSGQSEDAVFEQGERARRDYMAAARALGLVRSALLEKIVCHDMSVREMAELFGSGSSRHARQKLVEQLLDAVDVLTEHFGYVGRAPQQGQTRAEVERPSSFTGEVSTRRA